MYDEEGDPIVGTITEEEWDQIIEAVQDCLG